MLQKDTVQMETLTTTATLPVCIYLFNKSAYAGLFGIYKLSFKFSTPFREMLEYGDVSG